MEGLDGIDYRFEETSDGSEMIRYEAGESSAGERGAREGEEYGAGAARKVDVGLPGKGNSNSHGARPVHVFITII